VRLEVKNQYIFSLEGLGDIPVDDLVSYKQIAYMGFKSPEARVSILVDDPDYRKQLTGVTVTTRLGFDNNTPGEMIQFSIVTTSMKPHGTRWLLAFNLLAKNTAYISTEFTQATTGTSDTVIVTALSKAAINVDNQAAMADSQTWLQLQETTRDFVRHVWKHSHRSSTILLPAILAHNRARLRDLATLAGQEADFIFTTRSEAGDAIAVEAGIKEVVSHAMTEAIGGTGTRVSVYTPTTGAADITSSRMPMALSYAASPITTNNRMANSRIQDNVHADYVAAGYSNQQNLALLHTTSFPVFFTKKFSGIQPLDRADMQAPGMDRHSAIAGSGAYIVEKVVVTIMNKELSTGVSLIREASV